jgi:hypothetical protein
MKWKKFKLTQIQLIWIFLLLEHEFTNSKVRLKWGPLRTILINADSRIWYHEGPLLSDGRSG